MYVFTIKDFGSSRFTECTSITIHRSVFQFITIHDHRVTKISFPPYKFSGRYTIFVVKTDTLGPALSVRLKVMSVL